MHSARRGGFVTMVRAHHGLKIKDAQRARWVAHMTAAVDEVELDPEVAAGFARYVETASRLAMRTDRLVTVPWRGSREVETTRGEPSATRGRARTLTDVTGTSPSGTRWSWLDEYWA